MPPLPKRHHYVPEFLIRNFRADDNLVRFFDRERPDEGIVLRNPTKVLFEPHLYTRTDKDGQRDADLEAAYGRLEDAAAPIIVRLIEAARAKRLPNLSSRDKAVWNQFLYNQWRRVPELHATLFTDEFFTKLREDSVAHFEKTYRPINDEERRWLADKAALDRTNRNAMISSLATSGENVLKVLGGRGLATMLTTKFSKSFVLGSRPVVKLTSPGRTELSDHSVEMWLPVAPDVAVGLGRAPSEELLFEAPDPFVRGLNKAIAGQSLMLVSRSEKLLKSVCRL